MKKRQIAVLLSLMFAVPAGMVAIAQSESESTATEAVVEIQPSPEPVIVAQETTIVTDQNAQPLVVAETTTAVFPAEIHVSVQPKSLSTADWMKMNNEFRQDIEDQMRILPKQAAYFDQQESKLRGVIAQNDAFPHDNDKDQYTASSAQLAYFDRQEQQLAASSRSTRLASSSSPQGDQLAMADSQQPSKE